MLARKLIVGFNTEFQKSTHTTQIVEAQTEHSLFNEDFLLFILFSFLRLPSFLSHPF